MTIFNSFSISPPFSRWSQRIWKQNQCIYFNLPFDKARLKILLKWTFSKFGAKPTLDVVEKLKSIGYTSATHAGISLGIDDLDIPVSKNAFLKATELRLDQTYGEVQLGYLNSVEYLTKTIYTWTETSEFIKQEVIKNFRSKDVLNPVYMMAFSGARGNISQVRQLVGMRGLMADPNGNVIDYPIQSNFREGLTLSEYVISCYGARKGVIDTALRTATSGYLTRRLVDVAQHVVIDGPDCETTKGIYLAPLMEENKVVLDLKTRLIGRVLAETVYSSTNPNHLLATKNTEVTSKLADILLKHQKNVFVRSPLTCMGFYSVCQLCYGWNLATQQLVSVGETVGIIAAQSIGEPGTQLTMRTFHTGGIFSGQVSSNFVRCAVFGKIVFPKSIAGKCIRTAHGEVAFLTKQAGFLFIDKTLTPQTNQTNKKNILVGKTPMEKMFLKPYTLVYVKHGQIVYPNQILAENTSYNNVSDKLNTFQTIHANLSGEIRFYNTDMFRSQFYPPYTKHTQVSTNGGEFWILSAQTERIFKTINTFLRPGDQVDLKSLVFFYSTIYPFKKTDLKLTFFQENKTLYQKKRFLHFFPSSDLLSPHSSETRQQRAQNEQIKQKRNSSFLCPRRFCYEVSKKSKSEDQNKNHFLNSTFFSQTKTKCHLFLKPFENRNGQFVERVMPFFADQPKKCCVFLIQKNPNLGIKKQSQSFKNTETWFKQSFLGSSHYFIANDLKFTEHMNEVVWQVTKQPINLFNAQFKNRKQKRFVSKGGAKKAKTTKREEQKDKLKQNLIQKQSDLKTILAYLKTNFFISRQTDQLLVQLKQDSLDLIDKKLMLALYHRSVGWFHDRMPLEKTQQDLFKRRINDPMVIENSTNRLNELHNNIGWPFHCLKKQPFVFNPKLGFDFHFLNIKNSFIKNQQENMASAILKLSCDHNLTPFQKWALAQSTGQKENASNIETSFFRPFFRTQIFSRFRYQKAYCQPFLISCLEQMQKERLKYRPPLEDERYWWFMNEPGSYSIVREPYKGPKPCRTFEQFLEIYLQEYAMFYYAKTTLIFEPSPLLLLPSFCYEVNKSEGQKRKGQRPSLLELDQGQKLENPEPASQTNQDLDMKENISEPDTDPSFSKEKVSQTFFNVSRDLFYLPYSFEHPQTKTLTQQQFLPNQTTKKTITPFFLSWVFSTIEKNSSLWKQYPVYQTQTLKKQIQSSNNKKTKANKKTKFISRSTPIFEKKPKPVFPRFCAGKGNKPLQSFYFDQTFLLFVLLKNQQMTHQVFDVQNPQTVFSVHCLFFMAFLTKIQIWKKAILKVKAFETLYKPLNVEFQMKKSNPKNKFVDFIKSSNRFAFVPSAFPKTKAAKARGKINQPKICFSSFCFLKQKQLKQIKVRSLQTACMKNQMPTELFLKLIKKHEHSFETKHALKQLRMHVLSLMKRKTQKKNPRKKQFVNNRVTMGLKQKMKLEKRKHMHKELAFLSFFSFYSLSLRQPTHYYQPLQRMVLNKVSKTMWLLRSGATKQNQLLFFIANQYKKILSQKFNRRQQRMKKRFTKSKSCKPFLHTFIQNWLKPKKTKRFNIFSFNTNNFIAQLPLIIYEMKTVEKMTSIQKLIQKMYEDRVFFAFKKQPQMSPMCFFFLYHPFFYGSAFFTKQFDFVSLARFQTFLLSTQILKHCFLSKQNKTQFKGQKMKVFYFSNAQIIKQQHFVLHLTHIAKNKFDYLKQKKREILKTKQNKKKVSRLKRSQKGLQKQLPFSLPFTEIAKTKQTQLNQFSWVFLTMNPNLSIAKTTRPGKNNHRKCLFTNFTTIQTYLTPDLFNFYQHHDFWFLKMNPFQKNKHHCLLNFSWLFNGKDSAFHTKKGSTTPLFVTGCLNKPLEQAFLNQMSTHLTFNSLPLPSLLLRSEQKKQRRKKAENENPKILNSAKKKQHHCFSQFLEFYAQRIQLNVKKNSRKKETAFTPFAFAKAKGAKTRAFARAEARGQTAQKSRNFQKLNQYVRFVFLKQAKLPVVFSNHAKENSSTKTKSRFFFDSLPQQRFIFMNDKIYFSSCSRYKPELVIEKVQLNHLANIKPVVNKSVPELVFVLKTNYLFSMIQKISLFSTTDLKTNRLLKSDVDFKNLRTWNGRNTVLSTPGLPTSREHSNTMAVLGPEFYYHFVFPTGCPSLQKHTKWTGFVAEFKKHHHSKTNLNLTPQVKTSLASGFQTECWYSYTFGPGFWFLIQLFFNQNTSFIFPDYFPKFAKSPSRKKTCLLKFNSKPLLFAQKTNVETVKEKEANVNKSNSSHVNNSHDTRITYKQLRSPVSGDVVHVSPAYDTNKDLSLFNTRVTSYRYQDPADLHEDYPEKLLKKPNYLETLYFSSSLTHPPLSLRYSKLNRFKYKNRRQMDLAYLTKKDMVTYSLFEGSQHGNSEQNQKIKCTQPIGALLSWGTFVTPNQTIDCCGQIIYVTKNKLTLRYAQSFLLSSGSFSELNSGDYVSYGTPLLKVAYSKVQTEDIIQGIPKVEQLFEATNRRGFLHLKSLLASYNASVTGFGKQQDTGKSYAFIQNYIVDAIQNVYQSQGVNIADKHVEIIVKQMTNKVRILDCSTRRYLHGDIVPFQYLDDDKDAKNDKRLQYRPVLLGITRTALQARGFLSAASFQETVRVLSRSTVFCTTDFLRGLKENIIVGHLLPTGTGLSPGFKPY